jgi:gamma-glutamyltranspeptidase/glutathione hydrolase
VVTAGHYLAAAAGFRVLEQGGNAADAASSMILCLTLLEPQNAGLGGEVPVLVYSAREKKVHAISGQGCAPAEMTIEWFRRNAVGMIPGDGLLPAMVPAVVGTVAELLSRFGTMTFAGVARSAIELAEEGFPVYRDLRDQLAANAERFGRDYPSTAGLYLKGGNPPAEGELFSNPDWGAVLRRMNEAEKHAVTRARTVGIEAARDEFYRGETAARITDFVARHAVVDSTGHANKGFLTRSDLSGWKARVEDPVSLNYRGYDVFKCPSWTQGPVFLQQLALLQGYDLKAMGHNTAGYIHVLIECAKLAFADREAYYGDPDFDRVPLNILLSESYNSARRAMVADRASAEMRPGDPWGGKGPALPPNLADVAADNAGIHAHDTTHCDAVDRFGNMVAATPSGGWIQSSPVIPGLGFCLGTRGQMFYLNPDRPNALAPMKRPRTTLTPSLAMKDGRPWMAFGTPGGDQQDQWTLQYFLNVVEFGMNLQEAVDAPTVHTEHFPSSFYPRAAGLNTLAAEARVPEEVRKELEGLGHAVRTDDPWSHGRVMAVRMNPDGVLEGAASPRAAMAYALGW